MLEEFMETWKEKLPIGLEPKLDLLTKSGKAVVYVEDKVEFIRYVSSRDLPTDIKERLVKLFSIRKAWTLPDLEPFLR